MMIDQIKIEANAIRNQISGLPKEIQDEVLDDVIKIIREAQKGDRK